MSRICPRCNGTGEIPDDRVIGSQLRKLREDAGLSLREVARRLNYSAAHVSDLELGRRGWSEQRIQAYKQAIGLTVSKHKAA